MERMQVWLKKWCCGLAWIACLVCVRSSLAQPVLYVDQSAPPGGDGLSWATAFQDLQDGLAAHAAQPGVFTQIWVAEGVYVPDRGTGDRTATFLLNAGPSLVGGFRGMETSVQQRATPLPTTVLSGDIGQVGNSLDNSFRVVSMRNLFGSASIEGFLIRGGRADGMPFPNNAGGGLYNEGTMTVTRCVFEENFSNQGGGLHSRQNPITIVDCTFRNNRSSGDGGGVYLRDSGTILRSWFIGNNARFGGALLALGPIRVSECAMISNFANLGGAVQATNGGSIISRCTLRSNAGFQGGAAYLGGGAALVDCFIWGNASNQGGGVYMAGSGSVLGSILVRNFAANNGGALFSSVNGVTLRNNTVGRNGAAVFGGGLFMDAGSVTSANSIYWDNTDGSTSTQSQQITRAAGSLTIDHCLVSGWTGSLGGMNNFAGEPQFVNPDGFDQIPGTDDDNYQLMEGSVAVDAGDNARAPLDVADADGDLVTSEPVPFDIVGNERFVDAPPAGPMQLDGRGPIDLGAYEYQPLPLLHGDANRDGVVNFADLTLVLASLGLIGSSADVNGNGMVDFGDITTVLANLGAMGPVGMR